MKLRKLLRNTNTILNSSWKSLTRLKKSNISKFKRRNLKSSAPNRTESVRMMATVPELFISERELFREEQTVSLSQISLEDVIELAARQMEESGEICYKTDLEEWTTEEVYEEMNFNGRNENDEDEDNDEDEYMEMNFRRL